MVESLIVAARSFRNGALEATLSSLTDLEQHPDDVSEAVTLALCDLLSESWSFWFSRLLLTRGSSLRHQHTTLSLPPDPLDRDVWTVAAVRDIYEPALLHATSLLVGARAEVDVALHGGRTPLMCCAAAGWTAVASELLRSGADVHCIDDAGMSALHFAVISHEENLAGLLLTKNAHVDMEDDHGRSASSIASHHGITWLSTPSMDGCASLNSQCIQRSIVPIDPNIFMECCVQSKRPALLVNAAQGFTSEAWWGREDLIDRLGECFISLSSVPYAEDFGAKDDPISCTFADFFGSVDQCPAPSGMPYYYFSGVNEQIQPQLMALFRERLGGLPETLPSPFSAYYTKNVQFGAGSYGTGAPWHWHRDAFNILLRGRKRWRLLPPAFAATARGPLTDMDEKAFLSGPAPLELLQECGDIVYIPNGWGHSVHNEGEFTVCVAIEFDGSS